MKMARIVVSNSRLAALKRLARRSERGEDTSFEFTAVILPIVLMILLITFATLVRSSQMPAWMAATECARAAVATEDEGLGREQGEQAAVDSLVGNSIQVKNVRITITGDWTPDTPVACRVSYDIDTSTLAFFAELTGGAVPMVAQVVLRTEPYKSKWH